MTNSETQALLPCPFCGGEVSILVAVDSWTGDYDKIICQGVCDIDFNAYQMELRTSFITRWNTRIAQILDEQKEPTE